MLYEEESKGSVAREDIPSSGKFSWTFRICTAYKPIQRPYTVQSLVLKPLVSAVAWQQGRQRLIDAWILNNCQLSHLTCNRLLVHRQKTTLARLHITPLSIQLPIPLYSNRFLHFSYMQASYAYLRLYTVYSLVLRPQVSIITRRQGCLRLINIFNA